MPIFKKATKEANLDMLNMLIKKGEFLYATDHNLGEGFGKHLVFIDFLNSGKPTYIYSDLTDSLKLRTTKSIVLPSVNVGDHKNVTIKVGAGVFNSITPKYLVNVPKQSNRGRFHYLVIQDKKLIGGFKYDIFWKGGNPYLQLLCDWSSLSSFTPFVLNIALGVNVLNKISKHSMLEFSGIYTTVFSNNPTSKKYDKAGFVLKEREKINTESPMYKLVYYKS